MCGMVSGGTGAPIRHVVQAVVESTVNAMIILLEMNQTDLIETKVNRDGFLFEMDFNAGQNFVRDGLNSGRVLFGSFLLKMRDGNLLGTDLYSGQLLIQDGFYSEQSVFGRFFF